MIVAIAHTSPRPPDIAKKLFKGDFRTIQPSCINKGWYYVTIQNLEYWNKNPFGVTQVEWKKEEYYMTGSV